MPIRDMQPTCENMQCMIDYSNAHLSKKAKEVKQVTRKALKQFNGSDINLLKRLAQKVFNTYIRMRDKDLPCISCDYSGIGRQWHAGHYKPRGGNSLLAFSEKNVHRQCSICNNHLSGNLVPYRANLIIKIGLDEVGLLESQNTIKKWSVEELQDIIKTYRQKLKKLQRT